MCHTGTYCLTLPVSSLLGPLTGRPSRESLARYVEAHGMTWFIEASEAIDQERYVSTIEPIRNRICKD
jgi:hypothetical protein